MTAAIARQEPVVVGTDTWQGRALAPILVFIGLIGAVVSSLGAPLIPTLASDYGVSLGTAQWSLTVTLIVGAVATPTIGRLGDGPHRLQVLLGALGVLVCGSVLAALPIDTFALLLAGRALQGVGLAMLPLVMGVARDHLEPGRSRATLATLSVTTVVGVGAGYPLTGVIAENLSFHVGFLLAAILGVVAMGLAVLVVPSTKHRPAQPFDLPGAVMLGVGLTALLLAITEGEEWGWTSPRLAALAIVALAIVIVWIRHELRTQTPLVDLRLMRHSIVLIANVSGVLGGVGMYMLMSMITRYVQTPTSTGYGLGASVIVSGFVLLPMSIFSYLSSRVSTKLSTRVSPLRILPLGMLAFAASLIMFATARDHLWQTFVIMGIGGVGMGSSFAVMPRLIVSAVSAKETSSALALNQVLRTVGFSVGSTLAGVILTAHTPSQARFPDNHGYTVGAIVGIGMCLFTAVLSSIMGKLHAAKQAGTTLPAAAVAGINAAPSVDTSADPAPSGDSAVRSDSDSRSNLAGDRL